MSDTLNKNAVIYGGNGFVGSTIAELLVAKGCSVSCASRSGTMPTQLQSLSWAGKVERVQDDASSPSKELLEDKDIVICCVGSPPVPTFSDAAYEKQVFQNGTTNANVIELAMTLDVKRLVLIGADIPGILNRDSFGYAHGKQIAFDAAEAFAASSPNRTAVVLKPGMIYGVRFNKNGSAVPLDKFFGPLAALQRQFDGLPKAFVDVKEVASAACEAAVDEAKFSEGFHIIDNKRMIEGI